MKACDNPFLAIQYHLYEYPLYMCCPRSSDTLQVLIIGFNKYGQAFLDACLQNGQIYDKKLSITVLLNQEAEKTAYLSERPELANFYDIDGSLSDRNDSYGCISFVLLGSPKDDHEANINTLSMAMCDQFINKEPHYVFIAYEEIDLSKAFIEVCRTVIETFHMCFAVSYMCNEAGDTNAPGSSFCPLYITSDIEQKPYHFDIERMAFNTHLIWEKNLNLEYRTVRAEFRKNYNHNSCVSNVVSLKYKLYSLGIDLNTSDFSEAANMFSSLLSEKSNRGLKNMLVWIEHRRWVTEKLCLGWRRIVNLTDCLTGMTKDERQKRHVCIVRSRPDQKLAAEYRSNDNYAKWDTASDAELNQLDELDRMSVELHRTYVEAAKATKKQSVLFGNGLSGIRTLIEGDRRALVTFQEWFTCLKEIWNGEMAKVRQYKSLKVAFINAVNALPAERKNVVREQIKAFEAYFYPVLASMEYKDWKQNDVALIDNIPFILTYTENAYLVIPFATGENNSVFGNVAASTVVSPSRILYLYYAEKKQSVTELTESIPYVMEFMRKKNIKSAVEFILLYPTTFSTLLSEETAKSIVRLGGGRIKQVKRIEVSGIDEISENLTAYLKRRRIGKKLFAVEKNTTAFSYVLQGAGFYKAFPSYQFDSCNMKFRDITDCEMLGYIKKTPYITATDMIALQLSSSESSNHPEFYTDYKELWKVYQEKSAVWKQLCDALEDYSKKNDTIASFRQKEKNGQEQMYTYTLPFVCYESVDKILRCLRSAEIIEKESTVNHLSTDSCEVVIIDKCGYRREYDKLFSKVYALMLSDSINVCTYPRSREVSVVFDNLEVENFQISGGRVSEMTGLLQYFRDRGYIINLLTDNGKMNFVYSTRKIKELLTTAGKMLEVYIYHKVKELGKFDDVVSGFEIDWRDTNVKNEFDCILTKGFRTLFVECKARVEISQEFYFKIAELKDRFGVNATAVLIADTQEKPNSAYAPINTMQRRRGNMMDVVTIWRSDEISNIGHTLLKVINGTYMNEEEKDKCITPSR